MAIDLVRMPPEISVGFSGSFDFGTAVIRLPDGGGREATRKREMPIRVWMATKGLFTKTRIEEFKGFVQARGGAFYGFRFADLTDFSTNPTSRTGTPAATDQYIGEGDGVTKRFPMRRTYTSTSTDLPQRLAVEDRMIPIIGETDARLATKIGLAPGSTITCVVAVAGTPTACEFDYIAREWVFASAPASGAITWGGYYDWPVAFTEEFDRSFEWVAESWEAQAVPAISIELQPFDRFCPETDDPGGMTTRTWSTGVPLIQKSVAQHWILFPTVSGRSVQIEDVTRHNSGGPHLNLYNTSAFTITVVDTLTGSTMFTLGATGSSTAIARLSARDQGGGSMAWHYVLQAG